MISPTGSGKSLTCHITPLVLEFFKQGEREVVETVCLATFPFISLM